jgi:hypothetical protein
VTDVLGTSKPVARYYGDGSFDCPHCSYPVRADQGLSLEAHNPWCIANPAYPVDSALQFVADRERKEQEEAERRRSRDASIARAEEYRQSQERTRTAKLLDAKARGLCVTCLVRSDFRKEVKHRKACPLTEATA